MATPLAAVTGSRILLVCAAAICGAAAFASGEIAGGAVRAMALVLLLACAAFAVQRRQQATSATSIIDVAERHLVARGVGVALVVADGRRLVVGYTPAGVALLAELPAREARP